MYNRLYEFVIQKFVFLNEKQYGFQAAYFPNNAKLKVVYNVSNSYEYGKSLLGIFAYFLTR